MSYQFAVAHGIAVLSAWTPRNMTAPPSEPDAVIALTSDGKHTKLIVGSHAVLVDAAQLEDALSTLRRLVP